MVVILSVGWSKRMNNLARIALVLYCIVLTILPLSNLHVEDLLPDTNILTDLVHQETDYLFSYMRLSLLIFVIILIISIDRLTGYAIISSIKQVKGFSPRLWH